MAEIVTALCYMGGSIVRRACGIDYTGRPQKAVRLKHGITFDELEDKLCRTFRIDRSRNRISITYRYPTVVQPIILKYEPIPITDDDDVDIIFSTLSSHSCLSAAELYIDVQAIEDSRIIGDIQYDEVRDQSIRITTQPTEHVDARSLNLANMPLNSSAVNVEDHGDLVRDNDVPEPIMRQASLYSEDDDGVHMDSHLFDEDVDIHSEEDFNDDGQEAGTSHDVHVTEHVEHTTYPIFEAPSATFRSINWTGANVSLSSGLNAPSLTWEKGDEFCKGLRFADKIDLQTAVRQYSVDRHHEFRVVESEPNLWVVKCKNTESRCNWKLRGIKRGDFFEITRYVGPHTCISAVLS